MGAHNSGCADAGKKKNRARHRKKIGDNLGENIEGEKIVEEMPIHVFRHICLEGGKRRVDTLEIVVELRKEVDDGTGNGNNGSEKSRGRRGNPGDKPRNGRYREVYRPNEEID